MDLLRAFGVGGAKPQPREFDGAGGRQPSGDKPVGATRAEFAAKVQEVRKRHAEEKDSAQGRNDAEAAPDDSGIVKRAAAGDAPSLIEALDDAVVPVERESEAADPRPPVDDAEVASSPALAPVIAAATETIDLSGAVSPADIDVAENPPVVDAPVASTELVAGEETATPETDAGAPAKETPPLQARAPAEQALSPDRAQPATPVAAAETPLRGEEAPVAARPVARPEADHAQAAAKPATAPAPSNRAVENEAGRHVAADPVPADPETPEGAPEPVVAGEKVAPEGGAEKPKEAAGPAGSVRAAPESQPVFVIPPARTDQAGDAAASSSSRPPRQAVQAHLDAPDARQVFAAIRAEKGGGLDLRLDPPDLGRVRIHFSFDRTDAVTATVTADRGDTLDLMRRHAGDLTRDLQRAGFEGVRLEFASSENGGARDRAAASQWFAPNGAEDEPVDARRVVYLSMRTDNRLDRLV